MINDPTFSWKRLGKAFGILFGAVLLICCLVVGVEKGFLVTGILVGIAISAILSIYLLYLFTIILHESGHVIGALLCGLTICKVVIEGKTIFERKKRYTPTINHRNYVCAFRRNPTKARLMTFFILAPMMNIFAAAGAFIVFYSVKNDPSQNILMGFAIAFGFMNFFIGAGTLTPTSDEASDGSMIELLERDPEKVIAHHHTWAIFSEVQYLSPRDYSLEDVQVLEKNLVEQPLASYYTLHRALAHCDDEEIIRCVKLGYDGVKAQPNFLEGHSDYYQYMAGIAAVQLNDPQLSDEAMQYLEANDPDPESLLFPNLCREFAYGDRGKVPLLKQQTIESILSHTPPGTDPAYLIDYINHLIPDQEQG